MSIFEEQARKLARKHTLDMDSEAVKQISDHVRKQILDELAPKIKLDDYASHAFTKLHFQDIEALRNRVDQLEPEDSRRASLTARINTSEDVGKLRREIKKLRFELEEIKSDPNKLLRLSIDNFKLGDKDEKRSS